MPTRSNNLGGDRQSGNEGFDPWTDDDWRSVVDENDIDAAIGQHALRIFTATGDGLRPETQEMVRQRRGGRVLAIIGSSGFAAGGVIHGIASESNILHHFRLDSCGLTAIAECRCLAAMLPAKFWNQPLDKGTLGNAFESAKQLSTATASLLHL